MRLLERLQDNNNPSGAATGCALARPGRETLLRQDIKRQVHAKLIDEMEPGADRGRLSEDRCQKAIRKTLNDVIEERGLVLPHNERECLIADVSNEVLGLGPIEPLVQDPSITEIMVNGPRRIYIERDGKLELTDRRFLDDDHVMRIIEKIVAPIGRRIDESSPLVDARLKNGSRVNAIIPPLSINGPVLTIRKFALSPYKIEDMLRFGTMSEEMAGMLKTCVRARLNIVASGGTGSGKTTTLNVLSSFIPNDERIVTIEDAAEIRLQQEHVVTLESRQPNIEGKGAVVIRDLVRNALRMRPDRIVIGEVRGGEALDMLQAMNTGHDGSLTTAHANSPRDALSRLETMVLMSGMELPIRAIREQIASAIDLIIHQERMKDGKRRITHITEVTGMEGDTIKLQDIFIFKRSGMDDAGNIIGSYHPTGIVPDFVKKFEALGVKLPVDIFCVQDRR